MGHVRRLYLLTILLFFGVLQLAYTNCSKQEFTQLETASEKPVEQFSVEVPPQIEEKLPEQLAQQIVALARASQTPKWAARTQNFVITAGQATQQLNHNLNLLSQLSVTTTSHSLSEVDKTYPPVDIVITMDTSGSMSDEINDLKNELKSFIDNLQNDIDLRLVIAYGQQADPVVLGDIKCLSPDANISDAEKQALKDWISAINLGNLSNTIGQNESPTQVGLHVYENQLSCLRSDVARFLFVMSDEDERKNGDISSGKDTLAQETKDAIKTSLENLGIRVFAGLNLNGSAHNKGDNIAAFATHTGGSSYLLAAGLGNNLANFSNDLLQVVKNYSISAKPFIPGLIKGYVGNTPMVGGQDYTIDGTVADLSDAIIAQMESGQTVRFEYILKESAKFDVSALRTIVVSDNASNFSGGCAVHDGDTLDVTDCLSAADINASAMFDVFEVSEEIELSGLDDVRLEDIVSVSVNGSEIGNPSISVDGGQLVLDSSAIELLLENDLTVVHQVISPRISGISTSDEIRLDEMTVNGSSIDLSCIVWNGDEFSVDSCVAGSVDSIEATVTYGDPSVFTLTHPGAQVVGELQFDNLDTSIVGINVNGSTIEVTDVPEDDRPDSVELSYLDQSQLTVALSRRPSEKEALVVEINGQVVNEQDYTVRRLEPASITLSRSVALSEGDSISVVAH